jgi:hypothetical protein
MNAKHKARILINIELRGLISGVRQIRELKQYIPADSEYGQLLEKRNLTGLLERLQTLQNQLQDAKD